MVVVFGSVNADLIFPVAALPGPGQTLLATGMTAEPGGKGANQAVAAALDGAPVTMAGAVGADALADTALAGLRRAGVALSLAVDADRPTGCASICTDPAGRNQIVVAPGANLAAQASGVADSLLGPGTVLVTQMEVEPAQTAALIRHARALDTRIIHNLAPAAALPPDALRMLDVLVVNEDEAEWLAGHEAPGGSGAAGLAAALGITVVRTLGAAGVEWTGPAGSGSLGAAPVRAVDTTAAGDCFVGVLAAGLHRGDALAAALARANAAAGLACTRPGSQGSLPTAADIDAALSRSPQP